MPLSQHEVRGQVTSFIEAIAKLSAKEREIPPTVTYAERFNSMLSMAKEVESGRDARLWPEPLVISDGAYGDRFCRTKYVEIDTYARQILSLIHDQPLTPVVGRR